MMENIVDHVNYDIFCNSEIQIQFFQILHHIVILENIQYMKSNTLSDSIINIQVIVQGLGHGDDIYGPKGIENCIYNYS